MSEPAAAEPTVGVNTGDLNRALREARRERDQARQATVDLQQQVQDLQGQVQQLRAAPAETAAQLQQLQAQLRQRDHRDLFMDAALARGADPAAARDLYLLAQLQPGEDPAADQQAIDAFLTQAPESRPWAFSRSSGGSSGQTPQGGPPQPLEVPATGAPPAAGRAAPGVSSGRMVVTSAQLADSGWMAQHSAAVAKAQKEGQLLVRD